MYPVTQAFIEKMRADKRRIYARVQIDYTDPFLDQSIVVEASEEANVSAPAQTADALTEPFAKIASLDGSWVLDGTYVLAPPLDEVKWYQMGWWGKQLAQADGTFVQPYPALTVTHFPRPVDSLRVVGDSKRGEYPVDFTIELYGPNDVLLYTENVVGNTGIVWSKSLGNAITEVVKQVLTIKKWSHPGRQVKILEFFTSIQEIYEKDDILLIRLIEEREVSQGSLPVGNISANQIEIQLNNETRKFDAGNKQSPLYQLLKPHRKIKAWLGVEHTDGTQEWVPLGTFWSGDWVAKGNTIYAQTTGRDRLELLRKTTYTTSQVQTNKTLYELAVDVLQDAGLQYGEYWIDPELQEFIVPYAYFTPQSHREALRKIAEACLGQVFCDRNGILRIEGPSYTETKIKEQLGTYFLEGAYPAEIENIEAYGIGPDDYFVKDNPVRGTEIANYIEVETQPLRPALEQEIYRSNEPVNIAAGQTRTITIFFNESPCIDVNIQIEGTGEIESTNIYAWGAVVKVRSDIAGNFVVVAYGKPLRVSNKEKAIAQDPQSIVEHGLIKYTFPGNPFIQTLEVAQKIADKLLQYYKDPRRDLVMEWRGNPALELGDIIIVPDYQRGSLDQRDYYYITRQELEFAGYLKATLEGRRAL